MVLSLEFFIPPSPQARCRRTERAKGADAWEKDARMTALMTALTRTYPDQTYLSLFSSPSLLPPTSLHRRFWPSFRRSLFLSINRFERKKNLSLALRAYATYREKEVAVRGFETQLVLAGVYDERLSENVEYLQELKR